MGNTPKNWNRANTNTRLKELQQVQMAPTKWLHQKTGQRKYCTLALNTEDSDYYID